MYTSVVSLVLRLHFNLNIKSRKLILTFQVCKYRVPTYKHPYHNFGKVGDYVCRCTQYLHHMRAGRMLICIVPCNKLVRRPKASHIFRITNSFCVRFVFRRTSFTSKLSFRRVRFFTNNKSEFREKSQVYDNFQPERKLQWCERMMFGSPSYHHLCLLLHGGGMKI